MNDNFKAILNMAKPFVYSKIDEKLDDKNIREANGLDAPMKVSGKKTSGIAAVLAMIIAFAFSQGWISEESKSLAEHATSEETIELIIDVVKQD